MVHTETIAKDRDYNVDHFLCSQQNFESEVELTERHLSTTENVPAKFLEEVDGVLPSPRYGKCI